MPFLVNSMKSFSCKDSAKSLALSGSIKHIEGIPILSSRSTVNVTPESLFNVLCMRPRNNPPTPHVVAEEGEKDKVKKYKEVWDLLFTYSLLLDYSTL